MVIVLFDVKKPTEWKTDVNSIIAGKRGFITYHAVNFLYKRQSLIKGERRGEATLFL